MGNIAVDVFKNINFTKFVTKDIFKTVFVDVDNPDLLAESEADAEAFGPNALAQTDTFAYVNEIPGMGTEEPIPFPGIIDAEGNTTVFELGDPVPVNGEEAPSIITVNFTDPEASDPSDPEDLDVPDLDDINGFGAFLPIDDEPNGSRDIVIAPPGVEPLFSISPDLELESPTFVAATANGILVEYDLADDVIINFGERNLDLNGDNNSVNGLLTVTIPEGTDFIVDLLNTGAIEIDFDGDASQITISHPDIGFGVPPVNVGQIGAEAFVFEIESLQNPDVANIGDWQFEVEGIFQDIIITDGGDGEAFAYSESTAALDLDPFIIVEPEPEPVV